MSRRPGIDPETIPVLLSRAVGAVVANDLEARIIDAAKSCCERWGVAKVTVDDIATEAGCSRATVYRLFPGGRDNLFDAMRRSEIAEFLEGLRAKLDGAADLEDLVVRCVVEATAALRADEYLTVALAHEPGVVAAELTVEGLPRILAVASEFLEPYLSPHIGRQKAPLLAEWITRVVLSFFLAPSALVDLSDRDAARRFVRQFVLHAFAPGTGATTHTDTR